MGKKKRRKLSSDRYKESVKSKDDGGSTHRGILDFKKGDYRDVKFYKPKEGTNKIIIVPYEIASKNHPKVKSGKAEIGDLDYLLDVYVHRYAGANEMDFLCPKENYGKPCPICDMVKTLYSTKDEDDKKKASKLRAKRRVFYNLLEVVKGEVSEEIKTWEVSHFLFEKEMIEEAVDCGDGDDIIPFADPEDGAVIKFRMSIEKSKEYGESPKFKSFSFLEREEELEDDIIDDAVAFDKCLVVLSPDEILSLYNGGDDDDEDDEEDEPPKKSKKKKKPAEDDNDEDDNDEDDEEEEKPRKSKSSKKSKKKDDDNECPHGYTFGDDCDEHKECNRCDKWDECQEAQEG